MSEANQNSNTMTMDEFSFNKDQGKVGKHVYGLFASKETGSLWAAILSLPLSNRPWDENCFGTCPITNTNERPPEHYPYDNDKFTTTTIAIHTSLFTLLQEHHLEEVFERCNRSLTFEALVDCIMSFGFEQLTDTEFAALPFEDLEFALTEENCHSDVRYMHDRLFELEFELECKSLVSELKREGRVLVEM